MNDLVYLSPNTEDPFTTSEVIAECAGVKRDPVQKLIQRHGKDLREFGRVGFEIRTLQTRGGQQMAWHGLPAGQELLDADKSNRGIRKALFGVAGRTGHRTNLTTRYCVRAYCSTRERKRQDAKATTVNATAE